MLQIFLEIAREVHSSGSDERVRLRLGMGGESCGSQSLPLLQMLLGRHTSSPFADIVTFDFPLHLLWREQRT